MLTMTRRLESCEVALTRSCRQLERPLRCKWLPSRAQPRSAQAVRPHLLSIHESDYANAKACLCIVCGGWHRWLVPTNKILS